MESSCGKNILAHSIFRLLTLGTFADFTDFHRYARRYDFAGCYDSANFAGDCVATGFAAADEIEATEKR